MALGKDWDRESADLFIHDSGARISKTTYRGKMAWWFFPASLDSPAVEYAPTDEGRDEAFATSAKGLPKTKPKRKVKAKSKPAAKDPDAEPQEDEADEEDKEDKDENGE